MEIGLNDFEIGKFYGFIVDGGEIYGSVTDKTRIDTEAENEQQALILSPGEGKDDGILFLKEIKSYWTYELDENGRAVEIKMYDENLLEYGVELGETTDKIFRKVVKKWDEFDVEEKKQLLKKIEKVMTIDTIYELLDAFVDLKKYAKEEHEKCMKFLENRCELKLGDFDE